MDVLCEIFGATSAETEGSACIEAEAEASSGGGLVSKPQGEVKSSHSVDFVFLLFYTEYVRVRKY